jgi:hypothetical protein
MHSQYTCEVCGEAFTSKTDWETHNQELHPEREGSVPR